MKHLLTLLLACLLLCGCGQASPPAETISPAAETSAIATTSPEGLYDAGSELEKQYGGAVRAYPLNCSNAQSILAFGDGLLVLSGEETTTLTLLTGEQLHVSASMELDFFLSADDPSVTVCGRELSYYDPLSRETVVLDASLRPVSRIAAPEDLTGSPLLSPDRDTLYYCTSNSLCAWDLESGIRRTVKEMAYPNQTVAGLHMGGTIVHCQTEEENLFLAADNGRLVQEWDGEIVLSSGEDRFCAAFLLGLNPVLVFGTPEDPQILLPEEFSGTYTCLENGLGAVRIRLPSETEVCLEYYALSSKLRQSALTLQSTHAPADVTAGADGYLYVLAFDAGYGCDTIFRWDTAALATNGAAAGDYALEEDSQKTTLAQCQAFAEELGAKHGIEILIGENAAAVQPWDYDLEAEIQPALILRELELLDQRLARYPEGMLAATASNFSGLKLCLVRSVTGSAESGSLNAATGVQFFDGTDAYVAITVGKYAEQALYHELFHAMETHIFNYSIAFDQWETLNPSGFEYAYGYAANESRNSEIYLQPEHRAFIDSYSMSFPKEDRARIMEYAMMQGNKELFKTPALQAKLKKLCEGIREAYALEKAEEAFPWEQYLEKY